MPRLTTRLVNIKDACEALRCSKTTFRRKWLDVFTDARPPDERQERFHRKFYEDEIAIAVEVASKGKAAVLNYRRLMKRL